MALRFLAKITLLFTIKSTIPIDNNVFHDKLPALTFSHFYDQI